MTEHDWSVLCFVSTSRLASGKQLVNGLYLTDRSGEPGRARVARKHLKRLVSWRVLDPLPRRDVGGLHGGSDTLIYGVGSAGSRLLALLGRRQKRLGTPGDRFIRHTLACTQVVVELRLAAARRELDLIDVQQEPACWRSFIGGMGALVTLKPDLYVRLALPMSAIEFRAMIEVDLATESTGTLKTKIERYRSHYHSGEEVRAHGVHPLVVWAVPDERRAEHIRQLLRRVPEADRRLFAICLTNELISLLVSEAS